MKLSKVYNDIINEDFKTQTKRFIGQGFEVDIVKSYIDKFKHIRKNKYKEAKAELQGVNVPPERRFDIDAYKDFRSLEIIVDYVGGQRSVATNMNDNIEVSGEAVYKDDNIEVFYADNPRACVKYKGNIPYSWCVSRSDSSNMFYTYRFKPYEPAFYFVKDLKATEKEFKIWNIGKNVFKGSFSNPYHFFVIQVPKNLNQEDNETNQYIVTSANNDGDKQMSWNDIVKTNPKLSPIREILKPKPFTSEERNQHKRFKDGIGDIEFIKLSYEDKRNYLDIYPTIGKSITPKQLKALPDDLLNLYVSFGIGLDNEQHEYVSTEKRKAFKRYIQITKRKFDEYIKNDSYSRNQLKLNWSELTSLPEENVGEYLKTLTTTDINQFVQENGWESLELIKKHLPEKFDKEDVSIVPLITNANTSEESIIKLNALTPEGVEVTANSSYITFDIGGIVDDFYNDLGVTWEISQLHDKIWTDDYEYGYYSYDDYFDGYEEGLEREIKDRINEIINNDNDLKDDFISVGLKFDFDTVKDLLETYDKLDGIGEEISREYGEAENRGIEKAGRDIGVKMNKILSVNSTYSEVKIHPRALIMFIHDNEFFTTDQGEFRDNIEALLNEIYGDYSFPEDSDQFYEWTREGAQGQEPIDEDYLNGTIQSHIQSALDEYVKVSYDNDSEEYTDVNDIKKLKSEIISHLSNTLTKLGEDPHAEVISNDVSKIYIDRNKFKLSGQVYIRLVTSDGKSEEGYVNIDDIPTYFTNYKLFEAIQRFKSLMSR